MITTFFSYKGGVGRTTMVANVGFTLAHFGCRVLLIDADLEAPGLKHYLSGFQVMQSAERGFLDLLEDIAARKVGGEVEWQEFLGQWKGQDRISKSLEQYLTCYGWPSGDSPLMTEIVSGCLHLLSPKKECSGGDYAEVLRDFNVREFDDMFDAVNMLKWIGEKLSQVYDIVLIDSRTGFSEIGHLLASSMADAFVFVMAANQANLDGTGDAIQFFCRKDEKDGSTRKSIWVVPSRVPRDLFAVMTGLLTDDGKQGPLTKEQRIWWGQFKEKTKKWNATGDPAFSEIGASGVIVPHSDSEGGTESLVTRKLLLPPPTDGKERGGN